MAGGKQRTVSVQGNALAVCSFSAAQAGQASNITFGTALSSQSGFAINQLIDQTTAQLLPASISITPKDACNHANVVLQIGSSAVSIANRIDCSVNTLWGSSWNAFLTSGITLDTDAFQERSQSKSSSRLAKRTLFPPRRHLLRYPCLNLQTAH
jgi:hypothetical protein